VDLFQKEKYLKEQGKDTKTSNEELKVSVTSVEDF
jgi:hypothetical protein